MSKSKKKRRVYYEETDTTHTSLRKKSKRKKELFSDLHKDNSDPEISVYMDAPPPILVPIEKPDDRRVTPRFRAEFETVIFCAGVSFRTKTINVSLTGALLAESIPSAFVDQTFDIILIRHRGRAREFFMVKGKALEAPLRSPRIQFTQIADAQRSRLWSLLQDMELI